MFSAFCVLFVRGLVGFSLPSGCRAEKTLAERAPVFECLADRPRATATPDITTGMEHCVMSATAATAGRRRLRVPMPATWASTTAFSPDRPAKRPVGAVFRCVASRKREVGARRILPSSRAGPNPLGENQSLSSPPLEPRGLLLSVMRQKVGKERSQGVFAPLAIPQRFLACPLRKFGPSPIPP